MGPTHPLTGHHHYKSTSMDTLWGLLTHSRDTITINSHPWLLYEAYLPTHGKPSLQIHILGYSMGSTHPLTGHHHYKFTSMDTLWGLLTHSRDTITINSHPWILYGAYSPTHGTPSLQIQWGLLNHSRDTITINPWILYGVYSPTHGTPSL